MEKPFTSHLELTSEAEDIVKELEQRQRGEPLRLVIGEDIYAELEGIRSNSRTIYFEGDITEETREYLQELELNLREYDNMYSETAALAEHKGLKIETPTDDAFFQSIEEDINSTYNEE
ncbi:MAG: hypothetical protein ABEK00_01040 [Candidatus Nanohaloarchaea archaeon]